MKGSSMNTHMGKITIDKEVVSRYAGTVAVECFGIVGMAGINVKDGLVKLLKKKSRCYEFSQLDYSTLKKDSITRGIAVRMENNKLTLDFHVIIAYGVSIIAVSDNLIENVKYKVEEFTGIDVGKINVYVEGVRVID